MSFELPRIYPIVNVAPSSAADSELDAAPGARVQALAGARDLALALAAAGVSLLQLRAKSLPAGPFAELAAELVPALAKFDCRLIVNDRADVAAASGAAGVHLGDEDLPVHAARTLLGDKAIIGFSTHSVEEAGAAGGTGADYLGFGPVFDSPTKAGVRSPRGLEQLARACAASRLPVVAIGGITVDSAPQVWAAGARSVAMIREIEEAPDVAALLARYRTAASQLA